MKREDTDFSIKKVWLIGTVVIVFMMLSIFSYGKTIVYVMSGHSSDVVQKVVKQVARSIRFRLRKGRNFGQRFSKSNKRVLVVKKSTTYGPYKAIKRMAGNRVRKFRRHTLIIIGKSQGGIISYWMLKKRWRQLRKFKRIALVTIDPHGAIWGDGKVGPYCKRRSLPWPGNWTRNRRKLRVYNIYQHRGKGRKIMHKLTGASLRGAYRNIKLRGRINHVTVTSHRRTKALIKQAFRFVR